MGMTKSERGELGQLVRKREKVMKSQAQERSAALIAEFDQQSAKIYHWDEDAVWREAQAEAEKAVEAARVVVAERCEKLGIPREFAPSLQLTWYGRGHNMAAERRTELRRAAKSKIDALEKEAITKIERMSLEAQTQVIASGLESEAAKTFLNSMPAMDTLMPPIEIGEIQTLIESKRAERRNSLDYLN